MSVTSDQIGSASTCEEHRRPEVIKLLAEARKLDAETEEVRRRSWWGALLAKPILTALVTAVVTGILTWKFGLDAALTLNELNDKAKIAIKEQLDEAKAKKDVADKAAKSAKDEAVAAKQETIAAKEKADAARAELDEAGSKIDSLRLELGRLQASAKDSAAKAAIAKTATNLSADQQAAVAPAEPWFAVVASTYSKEEAVELTRNFARLSGGVQVEIYNATDNKGAPLYAVTLGGKTDKQEAQRLTGEARRTRMAPDAFAWHSPRWTKVDA